MAKPRKTYKKRPLWQWIVFYLIIGGIIYILLYYSGVIKLGNNNYNSSNFDYSSDYNLME